MERTAHYVTRGDVRGSCGHRHRTQEAAEACLERDRRGCRKQGGYSDRVVYEVAEDGTVPDVRRVAIHEAGHAVLACWYGERVEEVSVRPGGGALGHVWHTVTTPEDNQEPDLHAHGVIAWGGPAAEIVILGGGDRETWVDDVHRLADCVLSLAGPDPETQEQTGDALRGEAMRLIGELRAVVEEIASRLLGGDKVSGDDVRSLVSHGGTP